MQKLSTHSYKEKQKDTRRFNTDLKVNTVPTHDACICFGIRLFRVRFATPASVSTSFRLTFHEWSVIVILEPFSWKIMAVCMLLSALLCRSHSISLFSRLVDCFRPGSVELLRLDKV